VTCFHLPVEIDEETGFDELVVKEKVNLCMLAFKIFLL